MPVLTEKQRWTYNDYLQLDDNNRYEIYSREEKGSKKKRGQIYYFIKKAVQGML